MKATPEQKITKLVEVLRHIGNELDNSVTIAGTDDCVEGDLLRLITETIKYAENKPNTFGLELNRYNNL